MAAVDPAFRGLPKNSTFFNIWRIEKMQVVPIPRDHYGNFFTGDSYIVACATEGREKGEAQMKSHEAKGQMDIHIHFWLGNSTSQDEAGVAAYKTVELDDFLGGYPVQHREVQGWESKRFVSYFSKGIRLLDGGVASGFNHVTHNMEPIMFHIKGKRRPTIRQVPISWDSVNDGDVFILNAHEIIFIWVGKFANNMEKIQGARVAQQLKAEQGHSTLVIVEDGREQALPPSEKEFLDRLLPLKSRNVKNHQEVLPDEVIERKQANEMKLYKCSDADGTLKVTEMKCGPLDQKDLQSQDSFVVDNGEAGIWVWVGKRATAKERTEAMRNAQGFIKKKGYANRTQVTRVIEGGEPTEFKALFRSWTDSNQTVGLGRTHSLGKIARTVQTKFDASTLHGNPHLAAETQMMDDGKGNKEVFRVVNFDLVPLDEKEHGTFFSGDCYVVVYSYSEGTKEYYIIYYWMGLHSTVDEQGTAAMKTVEVDNKLNGRAVQVRVVQGKEPPHFMAIFAGRVLIFQGGAKSGFNNTTERNVEGLGQTYLLQVRGTNEYNTKATQVELQASSLNSNDVFALFTPITVYVWAGKGSTGDEREMAKRIAGNSGREMVLVSEGQEKHDFWDALGGHQPYSNQKRLAESQGTSVIRLFQCSNASGRFLVEEVPDFEQSDLIEDDVMLLDAWDAVFLWIGDKSNNEERKMALQAAQEYLKTDPSGRDVDTAIVTIKQGYEPPNFTGFFGVWETEFFQKKKNFTDITRDLAEDNPGIQIQHLSMNGDHSSTVGGGGNYGVGKLPLDLLQRKDPDQLPEGIDPTQKEIYLTDDDFDMVFHMTFVEFEALPAWKKINLKKAAGLF